MMARVMGKAFWADRMASRMERLELHRRHAALRCYCWRGMSFWSVTHEYGCAVGVACKSSGATFTRTSYMLLLVLWPDLGVPTFVLIQLL